MIKHSKEASGEAATNISIDQSMDEPGQKIQLDRHPPSGSASAAGLKTALGEDHKANNKRKAVDSSPSSILRPACNERDFRPASPRQLNLEDFEATPPWSNNMEMTEPSRQIHPSQPEGEEFSTKDVSTTMTGRTERSGDVVWSKVPSKDDMLGLPKKRQRYQRRNSFLIRRDSSRVLASAGSIMDDINRACFADEDNKPEMPTRHYGQTKESILNHDLLLDLPLVPPLDEMGRRTGNGCDVREEGRSKMDATDLVWGHASWANTDDTNWYSEFSSLSFDFEPIIPVPLKKHHKSNSKASTESTTGSGTASAMPCSSPDEMNTQQQQHGSTTMLPPLLPPPSKSSPSPLIRPKWSSTSSGEIAAAGSTQAQDSLSFQRGSDHELSSSSSMLEEPSPRTPRLLAGMKPATGDSDSAPF